jgi:hypothetical protein
MGLLYLPYYCDKLFLLVKAKNMTQNLQLLTSFYSNISKKKNIDTAAVTNVANVWHTARL